MNYLIWKKGQTVMYYDEYEEMKRVCVTVEHPDGDFHIDTWRGHSVAAIHRLAKEKYRGCYIQFGRWF